MVADVQFDAFALVSGLGPGTLIIRRSEVRVLPAPLFPPVRGHFPFQPPRGATAVLPNDPEKLAGASFRNMLKLEPG
jgi:hypothetical protein